MAGTGRTSGTGGGATAGVLALVLVGLAAVATWCGMGPLTETAPPGRELDYMIEAPEVERATEVAVGVGAVALAVGVAVVIGFRGRVQPGFVAAAIATAVGSGVVLGGSARVMTAGSVGANIGGGLALIGGLPTAAVLALAAIVLAWRPSRRAPV